MPELALGTEVGGCRVEEVIGRGGMGIVYRGRDLRLDRPVAIKLVASQHAGDDKALRRFEREAQLMASIDHPNVIPVYGAGEQDGHLYLVMRYVDGTDLHRLLAAQGHLAPVEAARIVDQVGRALDAAHARGLVHRDIKPANVLLSGDHVYLTDFGITRLIDDELTSATDSGQWVGTVDFMSPEHLRGEPTDARSDVYSLGCLLYATLTGTAPFHRATVAATILAHLEDRAPKASRAPGVPKRFDGVIDRAVAKRPRDRYSSAGRLGTAALAAAQGRSSRPQRRPPEPVRHDAPSEALTKLAPPQAQVPQTKSEAATQLATKSEAKTSVAHTGNTPAPPQRVRRRVPRIAAAVAALAVVIAAIAIAILANRGSSTPNGPLTRADVVNATQAFATAYGRRNTRAMAPLLAAGVIRIDPNGTQQGRANVLADYRHQFQSKPIPVGYRLQKLTATPGWVGRASADYTLRLAGGGTINGHVVFGLSRIAGKPEIGLIATQSS